MINAFKIVIDFGAKRAACEWMFGVAIQPLGFSVPCFDDPRTGIRAIVAAGTANDCELTGFAHGAGPFLGALSPF